MAIGAGISVFLFGAIIGSFLNVVILRLGTGESTTRGRSRCFSCGQALYWHELIPIASFFFQCGRCRGCGARISLQYPAVEFLTGVMFLFISLKILRNFQISSPNFQIIAILSFLFTAAIASLLITISVYDLRHQIIPDRLVYPFIAAAFFSAVWKLNVLNLFENWKLEIGNSELFSHLIVGAALFGFFAALWYISRGRWMGFGDATLAMGIGFWLGWPLGILAVLFAFWSGAVVGLAFLAAHRLKRSGGAPITLKSQIPFGPFLVAGAMASFLVGAEAIRWYINVFL